MTTTAAAVRHKLSIGDFHRMGEVGILREDDHVELIERELIDRAPIGSRHASVVDQLVYTLIQSLGARCRVRVQNPLATLSAVSEPQPEIAVVKAGDYMQAHPGAEDVLLLIEVADSSLEYDRQTKIPLYARHGVP